MAESAIEIYTRMTSSSFSLIEAFSSSVTCGWGRRWHPGLSSLLLHRHNKHQHQKQRKEHPASAKHVFESHPEILENGCLREIVLVLTLECIWETRKYIKLETEMSFWPMVMGAFFSAAAGEDGAVALSVVVGRGGTTVPSSNAISPVGGKGCSISGSPNTSHDHPPPKKAVIISSSICHPGLPAVFAFPRPPLFQDNCSANNSEDLQLEGHPESYTTYKLLSDQGSDGLQHCGGTATHCDFSLRKIPWGHTSTYHLPNKLAHIIQERAQYSNPGEDNDPAASKTAAGMFAQWWSKMSGVIMKRRVETDPSRVPLRKAAPNTTNENGIEAHCHTEHMKDCWSLFGV
ncbi:hypothetical protein C8R45DRAFT_923775 [Mycena sanguinolenta]|nr:hypothetical protein C8R45DRAFT_923775 [Mycena sanguinolenta]